MGKKEGWFSAVKKALIPQSKKNQKNKAKRKSNEEIRTSEEVTSTEQVISAGLPPPVAIQSTVNIDNEQNKHAYSVAVATAVAAEAAVAAAQAAAEVVRLTTVPRFVEKAKEEIATIKIQTAFRGYLARRALRALRGLVRLKSLIEGQSVKRQSATALRCMQTLARVQSQIRARRIRMSEENLALQQQLQQKHEKELEQFRMGEIWDDSTQSKEQIEACLQNKHKAAMQRERALAYAFTHQQPRKNSRNLNPTFMDPNNPQWGWSWLERWMAARPWEARNTVEKDSNDHGSVTRLRSMSVAGEINRAYDLSIDSNKPSPTGQRSSCPPTRQSPTRAPSQAPRPGKAKPESAKASGWVQGQEEDKKSTESIQSERHRRHSIAGSSVRDDESLGSSPAVPSYMAPTKSAKARTKLLENNGVPPSVHKPPFVGSVNKRLSFSTSPATPRRHSMNACKIREHPQ